MTFGRNMNIALGVNVSPALPVIIFFANPPTDHCGSRRTWPTFSSHLIFGEISFNPTRRARRFVHPVFVRHAYIITQKMVPLARIARALFLLRREVPSLLGDKGYWCPRRESNPQCFRGWLKASYRASSVSEANGRGGWLRSSVFRLSDGRPSIGRRPEIGGP